MPQSNFNPDSNPFADLMGGQGGRQSMSQQVTQIPQEKIQGSTQQATAEQYQNPLDRQTEPGQEGTQSKSYLQAISSLQNVITGESDPQKIQFLRRLVSVLVGLLNQEQETAISALQGQGGQEGGQSMGPDMGMGQGMGGGMQ